jgi:hypothetical protein
MLDAPLRKTGALTDLGKILHAPLAERMRSTPPSLPTHAESSSSPA